MNALGCYRQNKYKSFLIIKNYLYLCSPKQLLDADVA
jgi:hypothetical protein